MVEDQWGAPTSAELLADVTALALYHLGARHDSEQLAGTYHVVAQGETTWYEFARYVLRVAQEQALSLKVGPEDVQPIPTDAYPVSAKRPRNSRLDTNKVKARFSIQLPDWQDPVRRVVEELVGRPTP